jgi:hypothetical protein
VVLVDVFEAVDVGESTSAFTPKYLASWVIRVSVSIGFVDVMKAIDNNKSSIRIPLSKVYLDSFLGLGQ